jgi:hypothetical protein
MGCSQNVRACPSLGFRKFYFPLTKIVYANKLKIVFKGSSYE